MYIKLLLKSNTYILKVQKFMLFLIILSNCILFGFICHLAWQRVALVDQEYQLMNQKIALTTELKDFGKYKTKRRQSDLINIFTKMADKAHVALFSFDPENASKSWHITLLGKYAELGYFFSALFKDDDGWLIRISELDFLSQNTSQKNARILKVVLTISDDYTKQVYVGNAFNLAFDCYRDPFVFGKAQKPLGINAWPKSRLKPLGFLRKDNKKVSLVSDPNGDIYEIKNEK